MCSYKIFAYIKKVFVTCVSSILSTVGCPIMGIASGIHEKNNNNTTWRVESFIDFMYDDTHR